MQTVLEVLAIDYNDHSLLMPPQTGSYEAAYNEDYIVWVGPVNNKKTRIKHGELEDGLLVDFGDLALAKVERDQQKQERPAGRQSKNNAEWDALLKLSQAN